VGQGSQKQPRTRPTDFQLKSWLTLRSSPKATKTAALKLFNNSAESAIVLWRRLGKIGPTLPAPKAPTSTNLLENIVDPVHRSPKIIEQIILTNDGRVIHGFDPKANEL